MTGVHDERTMTRSEIGTYFRDFADDFGLEGAARVQVGDDVVSINPPPDVAFDVEIEDEPKGGGEEKRRLSFELTWEKSEYGEELTD